MKKTIKIMLAILAVVIWREKEAVEDPRPWDTFSEVMWKIGESWTFFKFLCGLIVGGLGVHFFWLPGCPACKERQLKGP